MNGTYLLVYCLGILLLSGICCFWLSSIVLCKKEVELRWSKKKAPPLGGVIVFVAMVSLYQELAVPLTLLFVIGLLDDVSNIKAGVKFGIQVGASTTVCGIVCGGGVFFVFFCLLFMVTLINAMNFIDNMDGLAGSIAMIACFFLFTVYEDARLLFFIFVLLGFLMVNLSGKIFLGDCGSLIVGFLLAYHCVVSEEIFWMKNTLILIVPLTDITFVTIRRLVVGKKPWIGGTDHLSHSLARRYGQFSAVVILCLMGVIGGGLALLI